MKYATPKLTTLTAAINAIQSRTPLKMDNDFEDSLTKTLPVAAYEDGE